MNATDRSFATARFLATDPIRAARPGQSPYTVIHRQNPARLLYFAPQGEVQHTPIFVSMPLINRWTIFDLLPGASVIEDLRAAGVPVYLLDWGNPGPEHAGTSLRRVIDELLHRSMDRALRHAKATFGATELDAVGYCVGGTFLAIDLARHPAAAHRACFVCTPIDFHASGRLSVWANPNNFPLDEAIDGFGNYPGRIISQAFSWLRPEGQTRKWMSLWERVDREGFPELWAALEQWNGDAVDFPGEAYREYVRRCYFDNALVDATKVWDLAGQRLSLADAKLPAHVIAADADHIVPPPSAFALEKVWGGPVTTETVRGGHVALCVSGALSKALLRWIRAA